MVEAFESDPDVQEFRGCLARFEDTVQRQQRVGALSLFIFCFCVLCVWLITDKGPLHSHWLSLKQPALLLALGSFTYAVLRVGFWWSAWQTRREVRRDYKALLEDRYSKTSEQIRQELLKIDG